MAYQLKTTGIAANCTMCIAVDPDTNTVKDFASSAVTADMTVGANVTISSQSWDGNTRYYWRPGSGTADADFVKFGTTKPQFAYTSGVSRTIVFIGEVADGSARVFGASSSDYFAARDTGVGGSTHPAFVSIGIITGSLAGLSAGNKRIFGFSLVQGTGATAYSAADTDASMTVVTGLGSGNAATWNLGYVNRRNDSTTHFRDKTHAILIFNTALTEAQWDSLRDDWFGTLLEVSGGGGSASALGASKLIVPRLLRSNLVR